MSHVLIVFQADTEPIERLALTVAVGAVESEGPIRLRRLSAPGAPEVGHQSYGRIKQADLEWADRVVVGLEHAEPVEHELRPLLDLLTEGSLSGKQGWIFTETGLGGEPSAAHTLVEGALRDAGLEILALGSVAGGDLADRMKILGREAGRG